MAALNFFNQFKADKNNGVHDMSSDSFLVVLTNTAPVATNTVLADLTEISYTNLSARGLMITSSTQTSGTYRWIVADKVLTASGPVATFRYVVLCNDTPTSPADPLICWYDHGSAVTLADTETFTTDFDGTNGVYSET